MHTPFSLAHQRLSSWFCTCRAINALIQSSAPDVDSTIEKALPALYALLAEKVTQRNESAADKEEQNEIQALLCGSLQAIVTKLEAPSVIPHVQNLMQIFLQVLQAKNSTVLEEALMAIGALADKVVEAFIPWAVQVKPWVIAGLTNAQEYHSCKVSITVTGDVSRALKLSFITWSDEVMTILLRHLTNPSIERTLKTHMIECMGDIATAVGANFDRYCNHVLPMLKEASTFQFPADDYDNQEYVQQLREAILTAYVGIIAGLTSDPNANKVSTFVNHPGMIDSIAGLLTIIADDSPSVRSEEVLRGACGLVYDLVEFCNLKQQMMIAAVQKLFTQAQSPDYSETTNQAGQELQAVSTQHAHALAALALSPCTLSLSLFAILMNKNF